MSVVGAHLVRVNGLKPVELPPLQAVRPAVAREWEYEQRTRALDDNYRKLRQTFDVVIEAKLPRGLPAVSTWRGCLVACALLLGVIDPAAADVFRPAYLQLSQVDATTYDVL